MNFERVSGWCELIKEFVQWPLTSEPKARSFLAVVPSAYAASVQKDLIESEVAFFKMQFEWYRECNLRTRLKGFEMGAFFSRFL